MSGVPSEGFLQAVSLRPCHEDDWRGGAEGKGEPFRGPRTSQGLAVKQVFGECAHCTAGQLLWRGWETEVQGCQGVCVPGLHARSAVGPGL